MEVDGTSAGLYFSAVNSAAVQAQKTFGETRTQKTDKTRRKIFSSAMEKAKEEFELQKDGFPREIAGLDTEEAAIYLKDQADMAADRLKETQTPEEFANYRKKIQQFLKYIEKNNFEVKKRERRGFSKKGKPLEPQFKIVAINEKLDEMARWLLNSHRETLGMLSRINEISGLLVDLMAS
ncbi:YaaR family protein [Treponema sp.]|uniref:YaaR family protein n=1 Tax=Treponema sp. TaxID=166 RepID=UPI003EFDD890